jgi:hypothetical protein
VPAVHRPQPPRAAGVDALAHRSSRPATAASAPTILHEQRPSPPRASIASLELWWTHPTFLGRRSL